jgi:predicted enzyme related to lactoylglutathione lyase
MPKISSFEISCDDMDRATKFYSDVFDWHIEKSGSEEDDYRYVSSDDDEEGGTPGGLMPRAFPTDSTVITFEVDSLDAYAERITEAGGTVVAPKISLPAIGYLVYCYDTEGNCFGVIEYDESAE